MGFAIGRRGERRHRERLYVILDNWPVHYHPDVLVALEPQEASWPRRLSASWPTAPTAQARARWGDLQLPIQLVSLPTYASWENPIEKLWRWAKQPPGQAARPAAGQRTRGGPQPAAPDVDLGEEQ